jgi:hypothetical protein
MTSPPESAPQAGAATSADPRALLRSRAYRGLLVFAALLGVLVSVARWGSSSDPVAPAMGLRDLPDTLGFATSRAGAPCSRSPASIGPRPRGCPARRPRTIRRPEERTPTTPSSCRAY